MIELPCQSGAPLEAPSLISNGSGLLGKGCGGGLSKAILWPIGVWRQPFNHTKSAVHRGFPSTPAEGSF